MLWSFGRTNRIEREIHRLLLNYFVENAHYEWPAGGELKTEQDVCLRRFELKKGRLVLATGVFGHSYCSYSCRSTNGETRKIVGTHVLGWLRKVLYEKNVQKEIHARREQKRIEEYAARVDDAVRTPR